MAEKSFRELAQEMLDQMQASPKLVRDKIPDIILAAGDTPITSIAPEGEIREEFTARKLVEEALEFYLRREASELGDTLDVSDEIRRQRGWTGKPGQKFISDQFVKRDCSGAFRDGIILERVDKKPVEQTPPT